MSSSGTSSGRRIIACMGVLAHLLLAVDDAAFAVYEISMISLSTSSRSLGLAPASAMT